MLTGVITTINSRKRITTVICFLLIILSITCGILVDLGIIHLPACLYRHSPDNTIYHSLFTAQATMATIFLTAFALLINTINKKLYGLSVAKYILELKPSLLFNYKHTILTAIILITLSGIFIAKDFNNTSVVFYFIVNIFLLYLIYITIQILKSDDFLKDEMAEYILSSNAFNHFRDLLEEIKDNISVDIIDRKQITLCNKKFQKDKFDYSNQRNLIVIQQKIIEIIRNATNAHVSSKIEMLELYLSFIETANEGEIVSLNELNYSYHINAYSLLSNLPIERINEKKLLNRWQYAIFHNSADAAHISKCHSMLSVAACLQNRLIKKYESYNEKFNKLIFEILCCSQKLLHMYAENNKSDTEYSYSENRKFAAEFNYICCIVQLLKKADRFSLHKLFRLDAKVSIHTFRPLLANIGDGSSIKMTIVDAYIIMFTYYLAYGEVSKSLEDNRDYYKELLKGIASSFDIALTDKRYTLYTAPRESDGSFFSEGYNWCKQIFAKHDAGWSEPHYGIYSYRGDSDIVLDFFIFCLIRLYRNNDNMTLALERFSDNITTDDDDGLSELFHRYVCQDRSSAYIDFYTSCFPQEPKMILTAPEIQQRLKNEYAHLSDIIRSLYCNNILQQAEEKSLAFNKECTKHEKHIFENLQTIVNDFCTPFNSFDETLPTHEPTLVLHFTLPVSSFSHITPPSWLFDWFSDRLNILFAGKIIPSLNLPKRDRLQPTATAFMSQFENIDVKMLVGRGGWFSFDDPLYAEVNNLIAKCSRIEVGAIGYFAAIDPSLIQVKVSNLSVTIDSLTRQQALNDIDGGHRHKLDETSVFDNDEMEISHRRLLYRNIVIKADVAIRCIENIVGGGYST